MFFLVFQATPRSDHPDTYETAGAFVCCWIERPSLSEALAVAREMISEQRWLVDEPKEARRVDLRSYAADPEHLRYFEQALIDKEVLVFYTYPVDETPEH